MKRIHVLLGLLAVLVVVPANVSAKVLPERAVRRDMPLTNAFRRAFEAGTRDSTGAPGAAYEQLEANYSIDARFDVDAGTITGRETVEIENNSPGPLDRIVIRLDQNVYSATAVCSRAVPDIITGTVVSTVSLNGDAIDGNAAPVGGGRGRGSGQQGRPEMNYVTGLSTTSADVWFAGSKTFEADLPFAIGQIESIVLDPHGRFSDRDPGENAWPAVSVGRWPKA
jgi:hypothetical protein